MVPRKLAEAICRSFWVVLLPVILVPVLVVFLTEAPIVYRASATVWVARPEGIATGALAQGESQYRSPAENQVQVFNDLLATRTFRTDIAIEAKLVPPAASEALLNEATEIILADVSVSALGTNLIGVRAEADTAENAYAIANAVIRQYQVRAAEETGRQAEIAVAYYTEQLSLAQSELEVRQSEFALYRAANPALATPELRASDATFVRLTSRIDSQLDVVDGLAASLQEVQLKSRSAPQSQEAIFSVQDAPAFPASPLPEPITTKIGYPLAGAMLGALISACYVYLLYRLDQTIRTKEDLAELGVPLLGYVPEIQRGSGGGLWHYTPFGWLMRTRARHYARRVAASIASLPVHQGGA